MVKEHIITLMEQYMKVNGKMGANMVKGHLYGRILLGNMKVNGKMENEMDLGNQFGLNQIKSMKGNIRMIKKMDLEQKFTRMEVNMLEISLITREKAKEHTIIPTETNMLENGRKHQFTEKGVGY